MMLPTGDPLGAVVTMLATPFGRLDGLAIDTAGAGGWLPTGSLPDSTSEGVIDGLPSSVSFPRRKVVVDGPPWGKIVGQRSPDTAIAVAVEDGINHGPHLGLAWPPTGAGRRQEGLQDSPLLACQITGVWPRVHTLSTFETPLLEQTLRPHPVVGCQPLGGLAGPDHRDAIQKLFVFDILCFTSPRQMPVAYRQTEMLGHLVMVDNFTSSDADIGRFLGRSPWPCHTRGQCLQFGLGGRKQFLALEPTLLGQLGVVASHQPFAGEVWGSDLSQAYGHEILSDQVAVGQQATDRAATQRRDPAQARVFLEHINLSLCEHATIANQHYARETKPPREGLDLVGNRLGIASVAGIDLYGDRPSIGVGQHTVDDDRAAGLAVAVVAEAGQRACLPLVVAAGDVVEHHRPLAEVSAGELFLDGLLPQEQPVHGVVEVILSGVGDIQ